VLKMREAMKASDRWAAIAAPPPGIAASHDRETATLQSRAA
jgi:hypothetical protein